MVRAPDQGEAESLMRTVRIFTGVLATLVALVLVASGPLMLAGILAPLAHQRFAYLGTPIIVIYVVWSLIRDVRQRPSGGPE